MWGHTMTFEQQRTKQRPEQSKTITEAGCDSDTQTPHGSNIRKLHYSGETHELCGSQAQAVVGNLFQSCTCVEYAVRSLAMYRATRAQMSNPAGKQPLKSCGGEGTTPRRQVEF